MMRSRNAKVQDFLDGIMMSASDQYSTLMELREIVFRIYPDVDEKFMYGGILFSYNSEDFSGLFVRKNHISFEFSNGYRMNDPNQFLEGGGKFRRHLKIRSYADIENKDVAFFVKQAVL